MYVYEQDGKVNGYFSRGKGKGGLAGLEATRKSSYFEAGGTGSLENVDAMGRHIARPM